MLIRDLVVTGIVKLIRNATIRELVVEAINTVTKEEIDALKGVSSNIQAQLDNIGTTVANAQTAQTQFKSSIANTVNGIKRNPNPNLSVNSSLSEITGNLSNLEHGPDVSGVTATADDVLVGMMFVDKDWNKITGTVQNRTHYHISSGDTHNYGYYDNNGNPYYFINAPRGFYGNLWGEGTDTEFHVDASMWNERLQIYCDRVRYGYSIGNVEGIFTHESTLPVVSGTMDTKCQPITASDIRIGKAGFVNGTVVQGSIEEKNNEPSRIITWGDLSSNPYGRIQCSVSKNTLYVGNDPYVAISYLDIINCDVIQDNAIIKGKSGLRKLGTVDLYDISYGTSNVPATTWNFLGASLCSDKKSVYWIMEHMASRSAYDAGTLVDGTCSLDNFKSLLGNDLINALGGDDFHEQIITAYFDLWDMFDNASSGYPDIYVRHHADDLSDNDCCTIVTITGVISEYRVGIKAGPFPPYFVAFPSDGSDYIGKYVDINDYYIPALNKYSVSLDFISNPPVGVYTAGIEYKINGNDSYYYSSKIILVL